MENVVIIKNLETKKIKIIKQPDNKICCVKCGFLDKKCWTIVLCRGPIQFIRRRRF